jgi:Phage integrase family
VCRWHGDLPAAVFTRPNAGPDGACRTVLLDDRGYVALLRLYLARAGYTSGPLFRASINGRGGPLSYDAAHNRWKKYRAAAGAQISIHQLRHAHATSYSGVSIEVVRRRLGHASTETTQVRPHLGELELLVGVEVVGAAADPAGDVTNLWRCGGGGWRGMSCARSGRWPGSPTGR